MIIWSYSMNCIAQEKDILIKLDKRDSLASVAGTKLYNQTAVTREIHNLFFRNIYNSSSYNEEEEFKSERSRLQQYEGKIIDSIIFIQMNALGENVYDTTIQSNRFEEFLSTKLHRNTMKKIIQNRYLFLKKGDVFTPYNAYENARIIRNSNIFHDVRISPRVCQKDSQHIDLLIYIQDEFPYGFSFSPSSTNRVELGIENQNIAGTAQHFSTNFRFSRTDTAQPFGYRFQYRIPNIFNKSLIDVYSFYQNYSNEEVFEFGVVREFSRPEITWAGGYIFQKNDQNALELNGERTPFSNFKNDAWISKAFPFRTKNVTVNAIITGIKFTNTHFSARPNVTSNSNFRFWNSNFMLLSLGYSRIKYVQDRLINGFGRTEDIPFGISINGLFGHDFTEFGIRNYFGAQVLSRYYTRYNGYINLSSKIGFYSRDQSQSQGVFDFNLQYVSRALRIGNFRLRNYISTRTTIGIRHDSTDFITLNDYNGIRGANNGSLRGNQRYTASFQSNLFIPISLAGFRVSSFAVIELAKIHYDVASFTETPLRSGASFGFALKNENLIFDVLQFQYGFFPSTSDLTQKGFLITSIIPFRFQNLDISKPNIIAYE